MPTSFDIIFTKSITHANIIRYHLLRAWWRFVKGCLLCHLFIVVLKRCKICQRFRHPVIQGQAFSGKSRSPKIIKDIITSKRAAWDRLKIGSSSYPTVDSSSQNVMISGCEKISLLRIFPKTPVCFPASVVCFQVLKYATLMSAPLLAGYASSAMPRRIGWESSRHCLDRATVMAIDEL